MLRSIGSGTIRVQARLNGARAITLCWTPNKAMSARSTMIATRPAPPGRRVDRPRDLRAIADEGDQIEEGREEDEISDKAEQQIDRARHDCPSPG